MTRAEELTLRQQRSIESLLQGRSTEQAAQAGGCSRSTLWRWRQSAAFREALLAGRRAQVEAGRQVLLANQREAASVVLGALKSANPAIQLRAALAVLAAGEQWITIEDLAARLAALEERADVTITRSSN